MDRNQVIEFLNSEIVSLTTARDSLMNGTMPMQARRGRKPGPKAGLSISANIAAPAPRKRSNMSPEGRKKIADMMRARWAAKRGSIKPTVKPAKKAAKTAKG